MLEDMEASKISTSRCSWYQSWVKVVRRVACGLTGRGCKWGLSLWRMRERPDVRKKISITFLYQYAGIRGLTNVLFFD